MGDIMLTFDIRRPSTGQQFDNQSLQEILLTARLGHLQMGDEIRVSGTQEWMPMFPSRAAGMASQFPQPTPVIPGSATPASPGGHLASDPGHVEAAMPAEAAPEITAEGTAEVRGPRPPQPEPTFLVCCHDGEDGPYTLCQVEALHEDGILPGDCLLKQVNRPEAGWQPPTTFGVDLPMRFLVKWPGGHRIEGPYTARTIAAMTRKGELIGRCLFAPEDRPDCWRPHPDGHVPMGHWETKQAVASYQSRKGTWSITGGA